MTHPVKSEEHSIEDILAVIRLQAAASARQDAAVPADGPHEPVHLEAMGTDLPKIVTRDEGATTASVHPFPRSTSGRLADVLRRAEAFHAADAPAQSAVWQATGESSSATTAQSVKREMVSFLDTRMSCMSAPQQPIAIEASGERPLPEADAAVAVPLTAALADPGDAAFELPANDLPDGAAELLRPLLKQWLTQNMPRIVERALHMEIAGMAGDETGDAANGGNDNSRV